jgi:NADH dehydrogenase [ubiquinone] 1 alpha subcomplex assembly factor 1
LQFDGFIDLDSYDTIAMKLKGDGRSYISTVSVLSFSNAKNWVNAFLDSLASMVTSLIVVQIYTENWVNSPGQMEDNSWQSFIYVPKGNWYIAKASSISVSLLTTND